MPCALSAPPECRRAAPSGRISFAGKEPGNRVIRMGADPMCAAANAGKRPRRGTPRRRRQRARECVRQLRFRSGDAVLSQPVSRSIRWPASLRRASLARASGRRCASRTATTCCTTFTASPPRATASTSPVDHGTARCHAQGRRDAADRLRRPPLDDGLGRHRVASVLSPSATPEGRSQSRVSVPAGKRTISAWHEAFGALTKA